MEQPDEIYHADAPYFIAVSTQKMQRPSPFMKRKKKKGKKGKRKRKENKSTGFDQFFCLF